MIDGVLFMIYLGFIRYHGVGRMRKGPGKCTLLNMLRKGICPVSGSVSIFPLIDSFVYPQCSFQ